MEENNIWLVSMTNPARLNAIILQWILKFLICPQAKTKEVFFFFGSR